MKRFFLLLWVVFVVGDDPELPGMGSVVIGSHIICPQFLCKSSVIKSGCATYANEDIIMEKCLDDWYLNLNSLLTVLQQVLRLERIFLAKLRIRQMHTEKETFQISKGHRRILLLKRGLQIVLLLLEQMQRHQGKQRLRKQLLM